MCALAGRWQFRRKIELQQVNRWLVGSWKRKETLSPITDEQTVPQLHFCLKPVSCLQKVSLIFSQFNPLFTIAVNHNDTSNKTIYCKSEMIPYVHEGFALGSNAFETRIRRYFMYSLGVLIHSCCCFASMSVCSRIFFLIVYSVETFPVSRHWPWETYCKYSHAFLQKGSGSGWVGNWTKVRSKSWSGRSHLSLGVVCFLNVSQSSVVMFTWKWTIVLILWPLKVLNGYWGCISITRDYALERKLSRAILISCNWSIHAALNEDTCSMHHLYYPAINPRSIHSCHSSQVWEFHSVV